LIEEVLPSVYQELLTQLIANGIGHSQVFSAFPTVGETKENWSRFLGSLFLELVNQNIFWTSASGGHWIKPTEAFYLKEDVEGIENSEVLDTIRKFLVEAGVLLVELPKNLMVSVKILLREKIGNHILGPKRVRQECKEKRKILTSQSCSSKLGLLYYILTDQNYSDMGGIELLPLDDGTFEMFDRSRRKVFISSNLHPKKLLWPGFRGRFLHQDTPQNFISHLQRFSKYNSLPWCDKCNLMIG
jgi:sacsin